MNCKQVQELLGRFHDGELEPAERAAVAVHLGNCAVCPAELAALVELSEMARALGEAEPPADLWDRLAPRLGALDVASPALSLPARRSWKAALVAALVLVALAAGWTAHQVASDSPRAGGPASNVAEETDPLLDNLLAAHGGERVSLQEAARRVDFRVLAMADVPDGCRLEECCVCKEGCCDLVQCKFLYQGEQVLLVQGSREHPVQPGSRPVVETKVNGKPARIFQCQGCLVCCWQTKGTALTLVGPRDLSQLVGLVAFVDQRLEGKP